MGLDFTWDSAKARSNLAKHKVSFELAQQVWEDPYHIVVPDRVQDGEERWHAVGLVGSVVVLIVVHTYPDPQNDQAVRIIGARKATQHERRRYDQDAY